MIKAGIQGINFPQTEKSIEEKSRAEVRKFEEMMVDDVIDDRIHNDDKFKEFYTQYEEEIVASSAEDKALIAASTIEELDVAVNLKKVIDIITQIKSIDPSSVSKSEIYRIKEDLKSIENNSTTVGEKLDIAWGILDEVKPQWLQDYEDRRNQRRIESIRRETLSLDEQIQSSPGRKGLVGEALISASKGE